MNRLQALIAVIVISLLCFAAYTSASGSCECGHDKCDCCAHVSAKVFGKKLDVNACGDVAFNFQTETVTVTLELNGKDIITKSFHISEKPKFCVDALGAKFCVEVKDMAVNGSCFSGKIDLDVKFVGVHVGTWDLGSFHLGGGC
eukprot:gb/GECH01011408.1/.p1 GENE.gb/GECH01011408.1/~~gb/GECH01011408.1/.p1  ORF type:complete len:144 (+),score=32.54 gb/GECH01011408.1/:1-432(+)